jgi:hypothetical protein
MLLLVEGIEQPSNTVAAATNTLDAKRRLFVNT